MNEKQRYDHIDIARGIAIILVVVGHSCHTPENPLNRLILSFHMPLFFFLSGVFAKEMDYANLLGGVKSKAKRLLIPQITLGFATLLLNLIKVFMGSEKMRFGIGLFTGWFLPVLFICSVLFMFLSSIIDLSKKKNRLIIIVSIIVILFLTCGYRPDSPSFWVDWLLKTKVAFLFYYVGYITRRFSLDLGIGNIISSDVLLFVIATVLFVFSQWNSPVFMYLNEYGNFMLFIVTSFIGIYVVLEFSKRLTNVPLLIDVGKLTIAIYVWNFLIISIVKSIVHRLLLMTDMYTGGTQAALSFIISMSILYVFSKITNNYYPLMYGNSK